MKNYTYLKLLEFTTRGYKWLSLLFYLEGGVAFGSGLFTGQGSSSSGGGFFFGGSPATPQQQESNGKQIIMYDIVHVACCIKLLWIVVTDI